ncbi:MAG: HEAT repeat domain-containing protein, partial [Planctomycetaceae bacterium]|nr:HEAT repeat domain-containing protein [Planctomycetaceae bacterium]
LNILASLGSPPTQTAPQNNTPPAPVANPPSNNPQPNPAPINTNPSPPSRQPNANQLDAMVSLLRNNQRTTFTCSELAKLEPVPAHQKEVATLLENLLRKGNPAEKLAAASALSKWGTADNIPFLIGLLDSNDAIFRGNLDYQKHVFSLLGRLKDPRALPSLVKSLKNGYSTTDHMKALEAYGSDTEPELLKLLSTLTENEWACQRMICNYLRVHGTSRSLTQLEALALPPDSQSSAAVNSVKTAARDAVTAIRQRNQ